MALVETEVEATSRKFQITANQIYTLVGFDIVGIILAWRAFVRVGKLGTVTATYDIVIMMTLLVIAMFFREYKFIQRTATWTSIIFAFVVLQLIDLATHNFAYLLVGIIVAPSMYWYFILYGEVKSYFGNRYVVFIFRRMLAIIPLFIGLSLFTFFLSHAIGDPVDILLGMQRYDTQVQREAIKHKFGLDKPLSVQYLDWVTGFIHGDLGLSFKTQAPVNEGMNAFLWETLKLQISALALAFVLSIIIGVAAAYYANTPIDSAVSAVALLGLSMPIFVIGIVLIIVFGGRGLGWFPSSGAHSISIYLPPRKPGEWLREDLSTNWYNIVWWFKFINNWLIFTMDSLVHMVLPLITLTFASMATFSRLTRASMLEILRQDYVMAARANGLSEKDVIWKHAFRNVLVPLITFLGLSIGGILAGAPITETVFTWPGLGNYFVTMLGFLDFPVMISVTMIITIMILLSNLITDIAYTFVDPRVTI